MILYLLLTAFDVVLNFIISLFPVFSTPVWIVTNLPEIFKTIMKFIIELQQYRKIGTVEECREAVEKQKTTDSI